MCFMIHFLEARDLVSLRTLGPLNDVELDLIALFQALVALTLNGTVMNEDVCSTLAAKKAVALSIIEPFYGALILCQWKNSLTSDLVAICMPRSESASTVATHTRCDAKKTEGVF